MPRAGADCPCEQGQTCWYVAPIDQDGQQSECLPNTGSGTEEDPFCGIQYALNQASSGDVVLALPGDYLESMIRFPNNKQLQLRSCAGPAATVVVRPEGGGGCIFRIDRSQDDRTLLEGFTITGGLGAGIDISSGTSPVIRGNVITGNSGGCGGGVYISGSSPLLWGNVITANTATGPQGGCGGGIYCEAGQGQTCMPKIVWCTIACNEAAAEGGGIWVSGMARPRISHCLVEGNSAPKGGGVFQKMVNSLEPERAVDCVADGERSPIIDDCLIIANLAVGAYGRGGGLYFDDWTQPTVINCTLSANVAGEYGGGLYAMHACVYMDNCILSGDTAAVWGHEAYLTNGAYLRFRYSDVHGGLGVMYVNPELPASELHFGVGYGDIDANPQFRDPVHCDYHVRPTSPTVDAGSNELLPDDDVDVDEDTFTNELMPLDLDANPRILNLIVDMGTYELTGAVAGCPPATIGGAYPPDQTVDARQPHPINDNSCAAQQGIGQASPPEPILIALAPPVENADTLDCWALCETLSTACGPNAITSVTHLGSGVYQIELARPITPGAVTTIEYLGDHSFVTYYTHPANVDGSPTANVNDINQLINFLNICIPNPGDPSCQGAGVYKGDINHSGGYAISDLNTEINLLQGSGLFAPGWMNTAKPELDGCAPSPPDFCICTEEPEAPEGRGGEGEGRDGGEGEGQGDIVDAGCYGAAFALYLTGVDLENGTEAEYFPLLVEGLTQVALNVFDEEQRHDIACALLDPQLVFFSPTVEAQVPQIAARLDP
ncbi:MAG TPA: right-handed parallel beta-helix repeat-containing protein [Phycisphaerae bacterium]|nr:right-handed parallel beta-helix repeat-containing protein [Phycisphaerae bacterium]